MKKVSKNDYITRTEFEAFTKGTFIEFTEGTFRQFTEGTFKYFTDVVFKNELAKMATKLDLQNMKNEIMGHMDHLFGTLRSIDQEQLAQGLHIKELRDVTRQHETRLTALEGRPA